MKTLLRFIAVIAVAISATAHAQTWLINLNNDTGYRGASQNGTDTNGNLWNNLDPWYWSAIQTVSGTSSGGFRGNILGTTSGVDSYNGPLGADVSNPLTAIQVGNVTIDSAALGALGGSKAAAAGYATSTDMKYYLSVTNTNLTYDVSFYGSYRYAAGNSTYTAYSDAAYTTVAQSTSLNVGGGGNYNGNKTATLTGLTAVTTPDASQGINLQLSGAGGVAGYLNAIELYGYIGYLGGSTTTLNGAPPAGYVSNGTYPNSDTRSVDTVIGGGSTVNVNNANGIYCNSTLVMRSGGGTINAGTNFSAYSLTGSGNLTLGGASTFSITHAGTYSGTLNLSGGTLSLTSANALGTGNLTLNGGTLSVGNAAALGTGAITVASGTTTVNNYNALTALTGNNAINLNGGGATLQVNGYGQILNFGTGNVTVTGTNNLNAFAGGMRFDGVVSGSGTVSWYGSGTLTLGGANTYAGTVSASGNNGSLVLANVNALQNATLNMGANQTLGFGVAGTNTYNVGALTGSNAAAAIDLGANRLNAGGSNATTTYAGSIAGAGGGLTKSGSGSLTLSGTNTYTGATTISAGTLILASTGSITSSSAVDLGTSGKLDISAVSGFSLASGQTLKGSGTVTGAIILASGSTLAIGNSPGTVTFDNNLTLSSGSISNFEINGLTAGLYDLAQGGAGSQTASFGGTINLVFLSGFNTVGTVKIFDFENYTSSFGTVNTSGLASGYTATFNSLTGVVSVVPEPSTWALLAFSLTTVMVLRRRRA